MNISQNVSPDQLSAIVALVRDATRIEMWALELTSALRSKNNPIAGDIEPKLESLSSYLDGRPSDLEAIRKSMAALGPDLSIALSKFQINPERLRNGVAAAVTYATMQAQLIQTERSSSASRPPAMPPLPLVKGANSPGQAPQR